MYRHPTELLFSNTKANSGITPPPLTQHERFGNLTCAFYQPWFVLLPELCLNLTMVHLKNSKIFELIMVNTMHNLISEPGPYQFSHFGFVAPAS